MHITKFSLLFYHFQLFFVSFFFASASSSFRESGSLKIFVFVSFIELDQIFRHFIVDTRLFFTLPLSHTRVECVCVCAVLHNVNKQNNRFVVRYSFHVLRTFVRSSELITDAAQLSLPVHILRALRIIGRLRSFIWNVSFFCLIILYSIII